MRMSAPSSPAGIPAFSSYLESYDAAYRSAGDSPAVTRAK
jgi:hypothetical protein